MADRKFLRVHNKLIHLDSISYIDILDSGRSMIFMKGVTQEKQHLSVDPIETKRLLGFLESMSFALDPGMEAPIPVSVPVETRRWR